MLIYIYIYIYIYIFDLKQTSVESFCLIGDYSVINCNWVSSFTFNISDIH